HESEYGPSPGATEIEGSVPSTWSPDAGPDGVYAQASRAMAEEAADSVSTVGGVDVRAARCSRRSQGRSSQALGSRIAHACDLESARNGSWAWRSTSGAADGSRRLAVPVPYSTTARVVQWTWGRDAKHLGLGQDASRVGAVEHGQDSRPDS